jgi:hypothetical protein
MGADLNAGARLLEAIVVSHYQPQAGKFAKTNSDHTRSPLPEPLFPSCSTTKLQPTPTDTPHPSELLDRPIPQPPKSLNSSYLSFTTKKVNSSIPSHQAVGSGSTIPPRELMFGSSIRRTMLGSSPKSDESIYMSRAGLEGLEIFRMDSLAYLSFLVSWH